MAADQVHREAAGSLHVGGTPRLQTCHHADDVLDLEGVMALCRRAAGGELHLLVPEMEARLRKLVPAADRCSVDGDDDVLDPGIDAVVPKRSAGRLTSRARFLPTRR
jgi:hypothetical protein